MSPEGEAVSKVAELVGLDYVVTEDEAMENGMKVVTSRITKGGETVYMVVPMYPIRIRAMFASDTEERSSRQILHDLMQGAFLYTGSPEVVGCDVHESWTIPSFDTFEELRMKLGIYGGEEVVGAS